MALNSSAPMHVKVKLSCQPFLQIFNSFLLLLYTAYICLTFVLTEMGKGMSSSHDGKGNLKQIIEFFLSISSNSY